MILSLQLNGVSVRYGDVLALDGVTAAIPSGSSVAVIGPNGSGKSTLLKVIIGILQPTAGTIDRGDHSVAVVLQSTDIDRSLPLNVRDTVAVARYPQVGLFRRFGPGDRRAVDAALRRVQIEDLLDRQLHHLSGGQRQRAFVAQGLAQEADILLLDEPAAGLDVVSRSLIETALEQERAMGRTTISTTHSFVEAKRSDLVMLLASRCVAFGPPSTVLTEPNLIAAFGEQFIQIGDVLLLDDPHHDHSPAAGP